MTLNKARVLVDFSATRRPNNGLGQFSVHLAQALSQLNDPTMALEYLAPSNAADRLPRGATLRAPSRWCDQRIPTILRRIKGYDWRYDLWHISNQNSRFWPARASTKTILTIHDLNFLREKNSFRIKKYLHRLQVLIDRADALTTISDFVRIEIEQHLNLNNKPVEVIYNGGAGIQAKPVKPKQITNNKPFLFSIGEYLAKKNFASLLPMLNHLPEFNLVLAGKNATPYGDLVREQINRLGLQDRVLLLGIVSDAEKQWLYQQTTAFVFPSLTEGFGLPILEAMAQGSLVVCSNQTSLPEIGGEHAYYWQDFEPRTMAEQVRAALSERAENPSQQARAKAHALTFSWHRCAKQYNALYGRMLGSS